MAKKVSKKKKRVNPHKSFKRSYREDYQRELEVPGIMQHIFTTFKLLFRNWKLFFPFLVLVFILNVLIVGVMSESDYRGYQDILEETNTHIAGDDIGNTAKAGLLLVSTITTGGLSGKSSEATIVLSLLIFLMTWLVTIYLLRHRLAKHNIKLRDALYNAMSPFISTLVVFLVILIQCIPIFLLIIAYSAAVRTGFLMTPFYALVFLIFAIVMVLISGYLLSSSLMALVAVSAPGLYPKDALRTTADLMMGRRMKFILRITALVVALVIIWVIIMLPLILFDLFMKQFEWTAGIPFVPVCLTIMTCFTAIYVTAYLYLYYRWVLEYEEN